MSVVSMTLFAVTVLAAIALLVRMFTKEEPFYGAMGLCLLAGPGTLLAFVHIAVA